MTIEELLDLCDRSARGDAVLRLVVPQLLGQPLPGFRGELLCVNPDGDAVYLYSRAQAKRIAARMRREISDAGSADWGAVGRKRFAAQIEALELFATSIRSALHEGERNR